MLRVTGATYGQLRLMAPARAKLARLQQEYPFDGDYTSDSFAVCVADFPMPVTNKRIHFLAAPDGNFYEPMTLGQQRASTLSVTASIDMGPSFSFDKHGDHLDARPTYCMRFSVSYEKTIGPSIKCEYGVLTYGEFETWDTVYCTDKLMLHRFSAESA